MKDRIIVSLLLNDLKRNKAMNVTLFLFIFISALLMATGVMAIERLSGSLEQIYSIAQPPHYLQMHVGDIDREAIDSFARESGLVTDYEIQDMVNIDGVSIAFTKADGSQGSLSGSLLDNYFVVQNERFDYLLNTENQIVQMGPSELGMPLVYARKYHIEEGDHVKVTIDGLSFDFVVSEIIRDAQMGSSLASSIRFAVNETDYATLSAVALRHENIIGFRLINEADINRFNNLYNAQTSEMAKNGIGITLPLIKMINSIGDGFMSGVMILVGMLLMAIAILNVKFSIQSTIEEEVREIGTLKAIGLGNREIKKLYKSKYRIITFAACLLAAFAAFGLIPYFMENIALNFGLSEQSLMTFLAPLVAVGVLYLIAMVSLDKVMRSVSKMTIISALVEGKVVADKQKNRQKRSRKLIRTIRNVDVSLSLHQFITDLKAWKTFILACFLCTLAILLPLNLQMTLTSPKFVNYVGAVGSDLRISMEYQPQLDSVLNTIQQELSQSRDIKEWYQFTILQGKINREGQWTNFLIESGDYQTVAIEMDTGSLPIKTNEIALSALNASRLELTLGDRIEIVLQEEVEAFEVVGIYQDITNGGLTAKIADVHSGDVSQYSFFINLKPGVDLDAFVNGWGRSYPEAKVIRVDQLIHQTLGSITSSLNFAVVAIIVMALIIMGLVAVLFLLLRLHKNYADNAILLAIGYKVNTLRTMYIVKSLFSSLIGTALGLIVSLVIGESVMSLILTMMAFGITRLKFIIQPGYLILAGVVAPIVVVGIITYNVTRGIGKTSVMTLGHE